MSFHHVAIATRDVKANHEFYTGAMGFALVKVQVGKAGDRGFAKHLFYDTGNGEMIAFWDFHDPDLAPDFPTAISTAMGLPVWANHIAFGATDLDDIRRRRERWLEHGADVMEIDHGWCTSIYTQDPNGILVEFCTSTRELDAKDREEALRLLTADDAALDPEPPMKMYRAAKRRG
jgi:catechol 2,3-dioxygenase-like lactoylglutathione lyase family enzyme